MAIDMTQDVNQTHMPLSKPSLRASATGRAALSRLRAASDISGGTPVREFDSLTQSGLSGAWFRLRVWGLVTKIVDGALIIRESGIDLTSQIAQFMDETGADVARFTIVRPTQGAMFWTERRTRNGQWFWRSPRRHTDLLPLDRDTDALLMRLGPHTRRNIRRSLRIAENLNLSFDFRLRSRSIATERDVRSLAERNRPVRASAKNLDTLEDMIAQRGNGFETRISSAEGALISLCRGFIEGQTAYLVYQINDPQIASINLSLLHKFKLVEDLISRSMAEIIFVLGCSGPFGKISKITALEELVTIRPTLRGLTMAAILAIALRGTRFGNSIRQLLAIIRENWVFQLRGVVAGSKKPPLSVQHHLPSAMSWLMGCFIVCTGLSLWIVLSI
jgi:DNA-binding transcriptional ArsR family regulator